MFAIVNDVININSDIKRWKVISMNTTSFEHDVLSDSIAMRPGRIVNGLLHGNREYELVFTASTHSNLEFKNLQDEIYNIFLGNENYYLYRDFRVKTDRTELPDRRILVYAKNIEFEKIGNKTKVIILLGNYGLPYEEDSVVKTVLLNSNTHTLNNSGSVLIDPRYCYFKCLVTIKSEGSDFKIRFNGKEYFWYKNSVEVNDVFNIDGTDVTKNGTNCFEECYKKTQFLNVGNNTIQIQGASAEIRFEYRQLYF